MTVRLIGALAAFLAVSGPGLAWAQRFDEAAALAELARARARWARTGLVRYRLSITPELAFCRATFEIEQDRVLATTQLPLRPDEPCLGPQGRVDRGRTVRELFDRIEDLIRTPACGRTVRV